MTEEEILKKAKKDKRFFEEIYTKYYDKIYAYVMGYIHNKENAEDITSITFEKALKGIDSFRWEGVSLQSWLYKIARNSINDFYRKRYNRNPNVSINQSIIRDEAHTTTLEDMLESDDEHIETQLIRTDDEELLYKMLMLFDEEDQYLLYYKYFEDMSNKDIAKITAMSETNVGTRLQRIREKIKKYMQ